MVGYIVKGPLADDQRWASAAKDRSVEATLRLDGRWGGPRRDD